MSRKIEIMQKTSAQKPMEFFASAGFSILKSCYDYPIKMINKLL